MAVIQNNNNILFRNIIHQLPISRLINTILKGDQETINANFQETNAFLMLEQETVIYVKI